MEKGTLKITGSDLAQISLLLKEKLSIEYENRGENMVVLLLEKYYHRTSSYQQNTVIIKADNSDLWVDVIGGGGGVGLLGVTWGSESEFIAHVSDILKKYAKANEIEVEEVKAVG